MKHVALLSLAFFSFACSTGPSIKAADQPVREPPAKSLESQYVASAEGADAVAEIQFARGSAKLAPSEVAKLEKAVAFARKSAPAREVRIAAWSDSEFPGEKGKSLPASAKKLADQRAREIQAAITRLGAIPEEKTRTVNMAVRPKTLDSVLHETDYRLKQDFEEAGLHPKDGKAPKFASKAVVLILNQNPQ